MDKYVVELNRIVTDLEDLCGLGQSSDNGMCYRSEGIEKVLNYCIQCSNEMPHDVLKAMNVGISYKIVLLSYAKDRMVYFGKKKLDYSGYPFMGNVAKLLIGFTSRDSLSDENFGQLNTVVSVLNVVEKQDEQIKERLGYRYLRIFLILIAYGSYCSACIVATFILMQFITKEA